MLKSLKLTAVGLAIASLMAGTAIADGHGGPYAEYAGTTVVVNFPAHPHYNAVMKVLPEFTKETGIEVEVDQLPYLKCVSAKRLSLRRTKANMT